MIEEKLKELAAALPPRPRGFRIREVCLTIQEDGTWSVLAGGHMSVHIGEYGGDFSGDGDTPDEAMAACLAAILKGDE